MMGIVMFVLLAIAALVEIGIVGAEIGTRAFSLAKRWSARR
jgi:hypothetical protein